jgi:hypothetical protein
MLKLCRVEWLSVAIQETQVEVVHCHLLLESNLLAGVELCICVSQFTSELGYIGDCKS